MADAPAPPAGFRKVVVDLPIYTFQIDFNRHVSNIVYVQWMEVARLKLLEELGLPVHEIEKAGFVPVLIETRISYLRPLALGDPACVELWLSELGNASAWLEFRFYGAGGALAATGRQKGLFVSTATMRPIKLTDAQRRLFEPYLGPSEAAGA
ncbi:MAG TPA: thioesterase family protein [Pelomicrobium sp.]|nr:thioesterase family protein [Pelomicrobium sp.]